jgi:ABC-type lipoprotein release transport system permease subunit
MYRLLVAWRFLWTRLVSYIATILLAFAVILFIVVMAVMEGMGEVLRDQIRKSNAHVEILAPAGPGIEGWREFAAEYVTGLAHVEGVTPFVHGVGRAASSRYVFECGVRGVDLELERRLGSFGPFLADDASLKPKEGSRLPRALVGYRIADKMEIVHDERVRITVQQATDPDMTGRAIFVVEGTFKTESFILDNFVVVTLEQAQRLFGTGDRVTGLGVWLDDFHRAYEVKRTIQRSLLDLDDDDWAFFRLLASEAQSEEELARRWGGGPEETRTMLIRLRIMGAAREIASRPGHWVESSEPQVKTWAEQRPELFRAVSQEAKIMKVILSIVIAFVAVLILCLLWVLVEQKVRDIGIFMALGARPWGVVSVFVLDGLFIGLVGTAIGLGLGTLAAAYVDEIASFFRLDVFPEEQFFVEGIPSRILVSDLVLVSVVAIVASVLASVLPALKAAVADPIESLRHE